MATVRVCDGDGSAHSPEPDVCHATVEMDDDRGRFMNDITSAVTAITTHFTSDIITLELTDSIYRANASYGWPVAFRIASTVKAQKPNRRVRLWLERSPGTSPTI